MLACNAVQVFISWQVGVRRLAVEAVGDKVHSRGRTYTKRDAADVLGSAWSAGNYSKV